MFIWSSSQLSCPCSQPCTWWWTGDLYGGSVRSENIPLELCAITQILPLAFLISWITLSYQCRKGEVQIRSTNKHSRLWKDNYSYPYLREGKKKKKRETLIISYPHLGILEGLLLCPPISLKIIFIKTPSETTVISGKPDCTSKDAHMHTLQCARATSTGFRLFQLLPNHPPNQSLFSPLSCPQNTSGKHKVFCNCCVLYGTPLLGKSDFECQFHLAASTTACFNATYLQIHRSTTNQLLQVTVTESTFNPFWSNLI